MSRGSKKNCRTVSFTEHFLSGVKVKVNESPIMEHVIKTGLPEKYAIVNLATGNVGFLSMSRSGEPRVIKNDGKPLKYQDHSMVVFCLDYLAGYAKRRGHK